MTVLRFVGTASFWITYFKGHAYNIAT